MCVAEHLAASSAAKRGFFNFKGQEFFAGPLGTKLPRSVQKCTSSDARRVLAEGNPDTHQKHSLDRHLGDDVTDIMHGLYQ